MTYDLSVEGPWHNFLANGLVVHNSEESGRYRELGPVFYIPPKDRPLTQTGKAMDYCFEPGTDEQRFVVESEYGGIAIKAWRSYQRQLSSGIAREVARGVLPLNTMSTGILTFNAVSLMHFLELRTPEAGSHPQFEVTQVAYPLAQFFSVYAPVSFAAFADNGWRLKPCSGCRKCE